MDGRFSLRHIATTFVRLIFITSLSRTCASLLQFCQPDLDIRPDNNNNNSTPEGIEKLPPKTPLNICNEY